ncbi:MAG TPA: hypothetical protein VGF16_05255 [Bryobacteraceae bacterium]
MQKRNRLFVFTALLFVPAASLLAQSTVDPSGHWTGTIQIPDREIRFTIDLAKNAKGELIGTFSNPQENLKGLPLRKITVEGKSIKFEGRVDQPFAGEISADGKEILGGYTFENYSIPFSLKREGAAQIDQPARIARIGKELEGNWDGTVSATGREIHVILALANRADGTASGKLVDLSNGELEIPVTAVTQTEANVAIEFKNLGSSYSATLNQEKTELAGTYRQGEFSAPLTLRRRKSPTGE